MYSGLESTVAATKQEVGSRDLSGRKKKDGVDIYIAGRVVACTCRDNRPGASPAPRQFFLAVITISRFRDRHIPYDKGDG